MQTNERVDDSSVRGKARFWTTKGRLMATTEQYAILWLPDQGDQILRVPNTLIMSIASE